MDSDSYFLFDADDKIKQRILKIIPRNMVSWKHLVSYIS